jgi:rhamnosyltransferase subunit B
MDHSICPASCRRIVLATWGSYGDLHPYIALACALRARGYQPVLATLSNYRDKIESQGVLFHAVGPEFPDLDADPTLGRRVMDPAMGTEFIVRELVLPSLRQSYDDLAEATRGADLLVSHPLTFAVPMVAEKLGVPWASSVLAPMGFLSPYDPPIPPQAPWMEWLRPLGPVFHRALLRAVRRKLRAWTRPCDVLRAELGLPPCPDPLFEGQHAPSLVLAMFSPLLGRPQRDWPPQTRVTGFPFHDHDADAAPADELRRFLDAGDPPLVFTLGTSGVLDAGTFYSESLEAARMLERRAVLLVGTRPGNLPQGPLPDTVLACGYARHSELFPRAAAVIHQGGVGTCGQALRSGRPMLVVPFAHDQPDNAARLRRLGVARVIARKSYRAPRIVAELRRLLETPRFAEQAARVGKAVQSEDGAKAAADAIEAILPTHAPR